MMSEFIESKDFSILKYRGWGLSENGPLRKQFIYWDENRQKWGHSWLEKKLDLSLFDFFLQDNDRENGFFMILQCLDVPHLNRASEARNDINIYCDPPIDRYISAEPHWQDTDWVNPIFRPGSFAEKFGVTMDNPKFNWVFSYNHVVYSGKPQFFIEYTNLVDLTKKIEYAEDDPRSVVDLFPYEVCPELEEWYIKQNPHFCARNLAELFRLIIDWDLAYHHFGNREIMGTLCHAILGTIDMPPEIYDLIYSSIPESVVSRYLRGNINAAELGEKPVSPPELLNWCKEKYWDLRDTHIDELHNVGDINDNHYCNRIFI